MPAPADPTLADRRKRLKYRSWHRGIKEMDLILGHFADSALDEMGEEELDVYEALISLEDVTLYDWITGREPTPADYDTPLLARIRAMDHMKARLWPRGSAGKS